tara:strand:+ start:185 stop:442 length:258 start_codon:yes stop_codon:yes gene_type:complete
MRKIDIRTVLIALLVLVNLYQLQIRISSEKLPDVSNVFLKDKIESLNRDVKTVYVKLKLLDNIQIRIDNLKQEIEDLNKRIDESR